MEMVIESSDQTWNSNIEQGCRQEKTQLLTGHSLTWLTW